MADEKLLESVREYQNKNVSREEMTKSLISDGYTKEDVNGAIAAYSLTKLPIGQRTSGPWDSSSALAAETKSEVFQKVFLTLLLIGVVLIGVDWNGYPIPYLHQYQIKQVIQDNFTMPTIMQSQGAAVSTSSPQM